MKHLEKSQGLLQESYKFQRRIMELKEQLIGMEEELEALNHQAFEALPSDHNPEELMLVEYDHRADMAIVACWPHGDDCTTNVRFLPILKRRSPFKI